MLILLNYNNNTISINPGEKDQVVLNPKHARMQDFKNFLEELLNRVYSAIDRRPSTEGEEVVLMSLDENQQFTIGEW